MGTNHLLDTQMLLEVFDSTEVGLLMVNHTGEMIWFNNYFRRLLSLKKHTLAQYAQQNCQTISFLQNLIKDQDYITLYEKNGEIRQLYHLQKEFCSADNNKITMHYYYDRSRELSLKSDLCLLRDKLIDNQFRDPITGLLNLKAFKLVMEPQIARCRRYGSPLTAIAMRQTYCEDPSNLDKHAEHVRKISEILTDSVRWADQMHYDNQGIFCLLLPETYANDAHALVKKISAKLTVFTWLKSLFFGATEWNKKDSLDTFMRRAKLALESGIKENKNLYFL